MMPWWRTTGRPADPAAVPVEEFPELVPGGSRAIRAAVASRIKGYTPEWSAGADGGAAADAGVALVKVFGEQAAPVHAQVNRLPEKYRREGLRIAGVQGRDPGVGRLTVVVTLLESAPASVPVPAGTQLTAAPPAGTGEAVVFETERPLSATPARLAAFVVESGATAVAYPAGEVSAAAPLLVLGRRPRPGNAVWLGLDGPVPHPALTLEAELAGTEVSGSAAGAAGVDDPALRWELLTAAGLVGTDVHVDRTAGLRRTGIVEIGTRRDWAPCPHPLLAAGSPPLPALNWLRVSVRNGRYDDPPRLTAVRLNAVTAVGAQTIRDEILEPVTAGGDTGTRRYRLARTPVLPGTVHVVVDAPDPADLFDVTPAAEPGDGPPPWFAVASLATSRPYDRHFVLEPDTGILTFGDGVRGAAVPPGFRHVRAVSYRIGGGRATGLPAHAGLVARTTIPFLSLLDNASPATGAADAEDVEALVARGPALLRARDRAVTAQDVEAVARGAPAAVGRVLALPGADADGTPRPGQLTLLVVGSEGSPPVPGALIIGAVTEQVAGVQPRLPLGARVVVRAARFTEVEVEVAARLDPARDQATLVIAIGAALDGYLHPVRGGDDGRGWPLGVPIGYRRLIAVIAAVPGVLSVVGVGIAVGGRFTPPCRDAPLPVATLPWPGRHTVVPSTGGDLA